MIFAWIGLSARLFQIMIIDSDEYRKQAFEQGQKHETLLPVRGNIYDRNNIPLTQNIIQYSLGAHPSKIKDKVGFAKIISEVTGKDVDYYIDKLESPKSFVTLDVKLRQNKVQPILNQKIPGLVIERKSRRIYPRENIVAQIVGFTDINGFGDMLDKGFTGIEKEFNYELSGKPGWVVKQVNGQGQTQIKTSFPSKPPVDGSNIQLTIDLEYQSILHEELYLEWMLENV